MSILINFGSTLFFVMMSSPPRTIKQGLSLIRVPPQMKSHYLTQQKKLAIDLLTVTLNPCRLKYLENKIRHTDCYRSLSSQVIARRCLWLSKIRTPGSYFFTLKEPTWQYLIDSQLTLNNISWMQPKKIL